MTILEQLQKKKTEEWWEANHMDERTLNYMLYGKYEYVPGRFPKK